MKVPERADKVERILFAGFEIGGQMQLLAETLRRRWYQATTAAYNEDFRGYQCDTKVALRGPRLARERDRWLFFLWALQHFDVFHFFWGVSLCEFWRWRLLDLPLLRLCGKKIVVHFRGLDVVDIAYFDWLRETALGGRAPCPPISRPDQKRNLSKWLKYADVVLVSEPDLHDVVPHAKLSPQVVDVGYWRATRPPKSEEDGIVRIVHAPSSRRKKGTDFIESAVEELQRRGLRVELLLAEKLPHHRIKELYEISDIGVDQVLYGWHGKVSVELMALGKPVVCYIRPEWGKHRPTLPIVNAEPRTLATELEHLVRDAAARREIGQRSREYVLKYHDVEVVADELLSMYGCRTASNVRESVEDAQTW